MRKPWALTADTHVQPPPPDPTPGHPVQGDAAVTVRWTLLPLQQLRDRMAVESGPPCNAPPSATTRPTVSFCPGHGRSSDANAASVVSTARPVGWHRGLGDLGPRPAARSRPVCPRGPPLPGSGGHSPALGPLDSKATQDTHQDQDSAAPGGPCEAQVCTELARGGWAGAGDSAGASAAAPGVRCRFRGARPSEPEDWQMPSPRATRIGRV